MCKAIHVME